MRRVLIAAALIMVAAPVRADVKLPAILGSHMVLQEGMKAPF